jgi:hypothetical protein
MEIRRIDSLKEGDMRSEDFPNTSDIDVSPLRAIINQTDLDLAQEEFWSLDIDDDEDLGYSDFRAGLDGDDWILAGKSRVTSSPKKGIRVLLSGGNNLRDFSLGQNSHLHQVLIGRQVR